MLANLDTISVRFKGPGNRSKLKVIGRHFFTLVYIFYRTSVPSYGTATRCLLKFCILFAANMKLNPGVTSASPINLSPAVGHRGNNLLSYNLSSFAARLFTAANGVSSVQKE